ncbi:MAG TPA: phosphatidate cytidylyltransferase [Steroidobacteraceae bacterium]
MTPWQKALWVFAGIVVALILASIIGVWLNRRASSEAARATVENFRARVNAWWVMIAVLAVAFALGKTATLVLFGFISFFALREFITLTPTRPSDYMPLVLAFFVLLPMQYVLIGMNQYGTFVIFIPVYGFLLLAIAATLAADTREFLERNAKIQWATMITIYCISYVPALLLLRIPGYEGSSALLLFYLLLVVQLSDVLQYVFGKLFGKRKLAPVLSPSKTVEGLVGGGLSATLIGGALAWITPFSVPAALAISFVIVVMGTLGGLTLSAMKRGLGAKDWGVMIEGHGGMLDRMDSVSFAAPVFFHITRFFYA